MLIRIAQCLATSQTPENTQLSPVVRDGCLGRSSNWPVTSRPTPLQLMPNGSQCATFNGFHRTKRCRRPAGGCSGIKPLRPGRQCSRSAGSEALHRFGEQKCCYSRGMVQTNRNEQDGQSTGSGETRGIHGPGKASATRLEGSESELEL